MMKPPFRDRSARTRFAIGAVAGLILIILLNVFGCSSANAAPAKSSDFAGVRATATLPNNPAACKYAQPGWTLCRTVVNNVWSPDARQAIGGAVGGCVVGALVAGGPAGCLGGAAGSLVGSIPYDGTWD